MNFFKRFLVKFRSYSKMKLAKRERTKFKEKNETQQLKYLVNEYNLIQEKKSNLPKEKREEVEKAIAVLISSGKLKVKFN